MRMSRLVLVVVAVFCANSLVACGDESPVDTVYTRARPDADFTSYKTFAIVTKDNVGDLPNPPEETPDLPDDVVASLEVTLDAVRAQLKMLDLDEVDVDESPDLFVVDFAATRDEDAVYWVCMPGWGWWGWWGWFWDPCAWLTPVPVTITVGSVLVLLQDEAIEADDDHGKIVFGGLLQGVADGSGNAEQRIQSGVSRMFAEYPADQDGDE
jgi:hypothetical protein